MPNVQVEFRASKDAFVRIVREHVNNGGTLHDALLSMVAVFLGERGRPRDADEVATTIVNLATLLATSASMEDGDLVGLLMGHALHLHKQLAGPSHESWIDVCSYLWRKGDTTQQ